MTALYNSKQKPIEAFGEDTEELHAFYTVMEELFPGSVAVQEALNESWNDKALAHTWTLPDGHVSHVKVVETVHGTLEAGGLKFGYTYHANQPSKVHTSLSPNFTHSYDGFIVRDMITNATFPIVPIHDEFKCHPNHAIDMIDLYKKAFIKVIEYRPLEQYLDRDLDIDYAEVLEGIKEAEYLLC